MIVSAKILVWKLVSAPDYIEKRIQEN